MPFILVRKRGELTGLQEYRNYFSSPGISQTDVSKC